MRRREPRARLLRGEVGCRQAMAEVKLVGIAGALFAVDVAASTGRLGLVTLSVIKHHGSVSRRCSSEAPVLDSSPDGTRRHDACPLRGAVHTLTLRWRQRRQPVLNRPGKTMMTCKRQYPVSIPNSRFKQWPRIECPNRARSGVAEILEMADGWQTAAGASRRGQIGWGRLTALHPSPARSLPLPTPTARASRTVNLLPS